MSFKFEKLLIWQKSFTLGERVNNVASTFPKGETYNLASQIRRATDRVGLNIAEGSTGNSDKEQVKFLSYANRSVIEVVACLLKANS
jgi:four helix bundle protein